MYIFHENYVMHINLCIYTNKSHSILVRYSVLVLDIFACVSRIIQVAVKQQKDRVVQNKVQRQYMFNIINYLHILNDAFTSV